MSIRRYVYILNGFGFAYLYIKFFIRYMFYNKREYYVLTKFSTKWSYWSIVKGNETATGDPRYPGKFRVLSDGGKIEMMRGEKERPDIDTTLLGDDKVLMVHTRVETLCPDDKRDECCDKGVYNVSIEGMEKTVKQVVMEELFWTECLG